MRILYLLSALVLFSLTTSRAALLVEFTPIGGVTGTTQVNISGTTPLNLTFPGAVAEQFSFSTAITTGATNAGFNSGDYSLEAVPWAIAITVTSSSGGSGFTFSSGNFFVYSTSALSAGQAVPNSQMELNESFDDLGISIGDSGDWVTLTSSGDAAVTWAVVPEPSTYALIIGAGFLGLALWRKQKAA